MTMASILLSIDVCATLPVCPAALIDPSDNAPCSVIQAQLACGLLLHVVLSHPWNMRGATVSCEGTSDLDGGMMQPAPKRRRGRRPGVPAMPVMQPNPYAQLSGPQMAIPLTEVPAEGELVIEGQITHWSPQEDCAILKATNVDAGGCPYEATFQGLQVWQRTMCAGRNDLALLPACCCSRERQNSCICSIRFLAVILQCCKCRLCHC